MTSRLPLLFVHLALAASLAVPVPAFATNCADCPLFGSLWLAQTCGESAKVDSCCGGCSSGSAESHADPDSDHSNPLGGNDCQKSCSTCCMGRPLTSSTTAIVVETHSLTPDRPDIEPVVASPFPSRDSIFHPPRL